MTVDSPPLPPPETDNLPLVADPPPPYPARSRRNRRQRTSGASRRQANTSELGPPGHGHSSPPTTNGVNGCSSPLGSPRSQRIRALPDDSPQYGFREPQYTQNLSLNGAGGDSSDYDEDRNILLSSPRISLRASQDSNYHTPPRPHMHPNTYHTYDPDSDDAPPPPPSPPNETTPFLIPPHQRPARLTGRRYTGPPSGIPAITTTPSGQRLIRRTSLSRASTISVAPSLAQTVMSLFNTDDDCEDDFTVGLDGRDDLDDSPTSGHGYGATWTSAGGRGDFEYYGGEDDEYGPDGAGAGRMTIGRPKGLFTRERWRRYFRPLGKMVYYRSLFHLAVLNFPYALAAWVYLFVFTVTGTTLLMALPLGALLCFLNLLGARTFARGELFLQTKFHSPLSYPAPYPPRPIFVRYREATRAEAEMGLGGDGEWVRERSFYRNAYAMFTDPTSYQALFYFLVIKPAITLVFSLTTIVFVIPAILLVLPAPAALRAVRRLGVWQANVAVEGLYLAVR